MFDWIICPKFMTTFFFFFLLLLLLAPTEFERRVIQN